MNDDDGQAPERLPADRGAAYASLRARKGLYQRGTGDSPAKRVPAVDFQSRTLVIYCDNEAHKESNPVTVSTLVSYLRDGTEWWEPDAESTEYLIDPDDAAYALHALGLLGWVAQRHKLVCGLCGASPLTLADRLGVGWTTVRETRAASPSAASPAAAAKWDRAAAGCGRLSRFADSGVSRLSMTTLRRILVDVR